MFHPRLFCLVEPHSGPGKYRQIPDERTGFTLGPLELSGSSYPGYWVSYGHLRSIQGFSPAKKRGKPEVYRQATACLMAPGTIGRSDNG